MSHESSPATLPEGWIEKELGDVCLKVSKIDPLDLNREIFKYVDIGSIDSATNSVASPQILSVKDAPGRARQLIQEGDTVFSTVRPYMKNIAYINESLDGEIASTGFCVIRPNPKIVSKGLIKFFSISDNLLEQILPLQRGVSYPAVRDKDLFSASILVPSSLEQVKIVEILEEQLSRLDSALDSVRVVREKAVRFRRSLLHAAFTGLLTSHDTLPGELPEGWVQKQLVDVCLKVSKVDPLELNRETFKYVDIGSIESETNSVESPQVLSVKDAPGRARQLLHQGDSVFSTVRPYLKNIAYINDALDGEIASTGFCVIRPNPKLVSACLLKFFVISDNLLDQILPLQRGVSYPAVRDREVLSALINLPPPAEQQKIVEILEEQLSRLNGSLAIADVIEKKASALRRSLLHAAFTGELTKEWREGIYV